MISVQYHTCYLVVGWYFWENEELENEYAYYINRLFSSNLIPPPKHKYPTYSLLNCGKNFSRTCQSITGLSLLDIFMNPFVTYSFDWVT